MTLILCLLAATAPVQAGPSMSVSADGTGCTVLVDVGAPSWRNEGDLWIPVIPGFSLDASHEGRPVLPELTLYVPVPPGSSPSLACTVLSTGRTDPPGALMGGPVATGSGLGMEWVPSPLPDVLPGQAAGELRVQRLAGTDVAVVTLRPMDGSDPGRYASLISARVSWDPVPGYRSLDRPLLEALCLPGTVYWPEPRGGADAPSPFWGQPWARISVGVTGMYAVSGRELADAGCDVTGAPSSSLRLFTGPGLQFDIDLPEEEHALAEARIEVLDGGDGVFDAGDTLFFFGRALERFDTSPLSGLSRIRHRYATHNVYWLTWGGESGARVDTLEALPDASPAFGDSMRADVWEEHEYVWIPSGELTTGWVWTMLFEGVPGFFYFSTPSPDGPGTLAVSLLAAESEPHRTVLTLNGEEIADTTWSGTAEIQLTRGDLEFQPSMNLLKITVQDDPGEVYVNYLSASYPRLLSFAAGRELRPWRTGRFTFDLGGAASEYSLLDVSDPLDPVRLRGRLSEGSLSASLDVDRGTVLWMQGDTGCRTADSIRSASPGRILGTGIHADIAIVTADELMEEALPLQLLYEQRGLTAAIVSAGEVYDEFGQGVRDPGAIRAFFRHTQDSWSPPASGLLLVGDGTYDPLRHITSSETLIPAYIRLMYSSATAGAGSNRDDFFVMAHEQSVLPEAPVSRIPAGSGYELSAYVAKLLAYQASAPPGQWADRILLVADDEWGPETAANEKIHTETCEQLADSILPPSLDRVKFYLIDYPWPPGTSPDGEHPQKPEAREDFVEELSSGCANVIFFGHGSYDQIAHEKLLVTSDLERIDNGQRLPVFVFASCDVGHFDMISASSMGEEFALHPGAGAIASIAATRGTYSGNNALLFGSFYERLFGPDRPDAGTALWLAKLDNAGSISLNSFNVVLGDGGVLPVFPGSGGTSLTIAGDTLRRGRINAMALDFSSCTAAFPRVTESGRILTYQCLGGLSFDYLRYGSPIYSGFASGGTSIDIEFFVPLQADTGSFSRCSAVGVSPLLAESAFEEWVDLVDRGGYVQDTMPPRVESWIDGHRGESVPGVAGEVLMRLSASDSSGINAMGGGAGRSILMSLDSQGFDISRWFAYLPGSHTEGELEYTLPELGEGAHRIIIALWDGMGNQTRDTLDFVTIDGPEEPLHAVLVYPNPGDGARCFSFETGGSGSVLIRVFTVAGRRIWEGTSPCDRGYGQVMWDGLDMDGDPPASGPYVYTVRFTGADGRTGERTGILAVVRNG